VDSTPFLNVELDEDSLRSKYQIDLFIYFDTIYVWQTDRQTEKTR